MGGFEDFLKERCGGSRAVNQVHIPMVAIVSHSQVSCTTYWLRQIKCSKRGE